MRRIVNMLGSWRLLAGLSILMFFLAVELIVVGTTADNIENSAVKLDRRLRGLKINETEQTLRQLDSVIDSYGFPMMNSRDARVWMLEVLEDFRIKYGARITSPVSQKGSAYTASLEFRFLPEKPEDLVRLLEYFRNSIAPVYEITALHFRNEDDTKAVVIRADLTQPFAGGGYEY